jgi:hypothetical protein
MIRKIKQKTIYKNTIALAASERIELGGYLKRADRVGHQRDAMTGELSRSARIALKSDLLQFVNKLLQKAYDIAVEDKEEGVA